MLNGSISTYIPVHTSTVYIHIGQRMTAYTMNEEQGHMIGCFEKKYIKMALPAGAHEKCITL